MAVTDVNSAFRAFLFRASLTLIITAFVVWGLIMVYRELHAPTEPVDTCGRAKDIFVIIFPVMTSAVAYWLGADGKEKADSRADQARQTLLDAVKAHPGAFTK